MYRRFRSTAGPSERELPRDELALRQSVAEVVGRTLHIRQMSSSDVFRCMPNWRSGELTKLKTGEIGKFGSTKLLTLAQAVGVKLRVDAVPADAHDREPDLRLRRLFRELAAADHACHAALPDIGVRTYPLAHVATRAAGTMCLHAVEAIRRNPQLWHRVSLLFSACLFPRRSCWSAWRRSPSRFRARSISCA